MPNIYRDVSHLFCVRYVLKPSVLRHAKVIPFNMFDQRLGNIVPSKITIKVRKHTCILLNSI